jgi:hypothetical protein
VSLLFCLGHMSGYPWTPGEAVEARAVVEQMHGVSFDAVGAQRTYWDFYLGFGLLVGAGLAMVTAILGSIAKLAGEQPRQALAPAACAWLFMLVNAALSHLYFFWIPTSLAVTTVLVLSLGLVQMRAQAMARIRSEGDAVHEQRAGVAAVGSKLHAE